MKAKIRPNGNEIFRNKQASDYFNEIASYPFISECGVNKHGRIFFKHTDGTLFGYSRNEFIKCAKRYYQKSALPEHGNR